jgi:hypothetical protein
MHNTAMKNTWITYHFLILLTSSVGDTTILLASIKHKALKLNKLIVVTIHHITVCNLLTSATVVLPRMVSLVAERWIFRNWLCHILGYTNYYLLTVSVLLLCAMTTTKVFVFKYPLKARFTAEKNSQIMCGAVWACSCLIPLLFLLVDQDDVTFGYRVYGCVYRFNSSTWVSLVPLYVILILIIPNIQVISCTVMMVRRIIKANKVSNSLGRSPRYQGIVTVVLTALSFVVLHLPQGIYLLAEDYVPQSNTHFHSYFYRLAVSLSYVNTFSNFFIYNMTVPSFRAFLWSSARVIERQWRQFKSSLRLIDNYLHYF